MHGEDTHHTGLVPHHFDMDLIDVPTIADHYYYPADHLDSFPAYHTPSHIADHHDVAHDSLALQNLLQSNYYYANDLPKQDSVPAHPTTHHETHDIHPELEYE